MPVSTVTYTANGSTNQFSITFPYIDAAHVLVSVNGSSASFTFHNSTTAQLSSTPTSGQTVVVYRQTPSSALVDFTDGSTLFESDLDLANTQARYLSEEARDRADSAITTVTANITNIDTVAGIAGNVTTVAGANANIATVAGANSNISTVVGNLTNINTVAGINSNISSVAGNASNITAVANDATDIGVVAGKATEISALGTSANITNMATLGASGVVADIATVAGVASTMSAAATNASNAASSASAAANSAAAAATALDSFDDRYLGSKSSEPSVDNDGNALVSGALFFDSAVGSMKVFDGGNWILATSAGAASLLDYEFTATAGQTTFTGSDNNSATLSYTAGNLIVSLNGIILDNGSDYTATSGTSIVLASGAALNDHLAVVAFKSFTVADTVPASTGGTFAGNVAVTGTISTTGKVALPATLGSAGQVLTVNGGASAAAWASPAGSFASLSDTTVSSSDPTISTNPASGVGHMWINTTTGFVYVLRDATAGANEWTNVGRGQYDVDPFEFVTATGGTVTTDGDFKVHTFNSSGNFVVTNTSGSLRTMDYLMIAGGGSGGGTAATDYVSGGGGGAGGLFTATVTPSLNTTYPIVIGGGGAYSTTWTDVASGSNTTFYGLTALGGGKGGSGYNTGSAVAQAADGGSGGGRGIWGEGTQNGNSAAVGRVGLGTTGQGNNGGSSLNGITGSNRYPVAAGGGGGAGGVGLTPTVQGTGGQGGTGISSSITGVGTYYGGGGGGGGSSISGAGGNGGGGSSTAAGLPNTGAGGAGATGNRNNGNGGGSGVVIIRYQFQN